MTSFKINDAVFAVWAYAPNNGLLLSKTVNGVATGYVYDRYGREISETVGGTPTYRWTYDAHDNITVFKDNNLHRTYYYFYDSNGQLIRTSFTEGSSNKEAEATDYNTTIKAG